MTRRTSAKADRLRYELARDAEASLPGVAAAKARDILQREADRPLRGGSADMQHNGLFGDAHKQLDLF